MAKNHFNKKKVTAAEVAPVQTETLIPALDIGEVNLNEESVVVKEIGELESLTKETTTSDFAELNKYKVTAKGGLVLRENPPSDTHTTSGMYAGSGIGCIPCGDNFVETKRTNNWSYGNYNGKSGWVCNIYLVKEG